MRLLIAGGGTGGHLFPGIAVAEEFMARSDENSIIFMGTKKGIESRIIPPLGYGLALIRSSGLAQKAFAERIKALIDIPIGIVQALKWIIRFKPDFALGVGGYVSGPALLAAWIMRVPRAIQEQNTVPGVTNRILSRFADRIFISFEGSRRYLGGKDGNARIKLTGNPIRKKIVERLVSEGGAENKRERFCLLVMGGSQGAHKINELMVESISEGLNKIAKELRIIHQTGEKDRDIVEKAYRNHGFSSEVMAFTENIEEYLVQADAVISRAGAGAIAEIALSGKPSILIPFPYAAGDHQTINAQYLAEAGAARLFNESETNGRKIAEAVRELMENESTRKNMAEKARGLAKPEAAKEIVDEIFNMARADKRNLAEKAE